MPRISKKDQQTTAMPKALADALRAIEKESALWQDVSKQSRLTYESQYASMQHKDENGNTGLKIDLSTLRKGTRYVKKSAGLYVMRKQLKATLREAKALLKSGAKGDVTSETANRLYGEKIAEGFKLVKKIEAFQALPWGEIEDKKAHYRQADHKQRPATDAQLVAFYESAQRSSFKTAFLVCEFAGTRPEELGKGVRVELVKISGAVALRFHIESAKCDGAKKGLDVRVVEVKAPTEATKAVKERFKELANIVAGSKTKTGLTVFVEKTEKQTSGQRLTNAFKTTAKASGVDMSAYSMRHRFSAQVKQANPGDAVAVALALGHQTTETQRHYARATRGKSGISPVSIVGVNVGGSEIRGNATRSGPATHTKEQKIIERALPAVKPSAPRPRL